MSGMIKEFITSVVLDPYQVDKDTGAPLSGGYAMFFVDTDRTSGKQVFQKVNVGTPGNPIYQFVSLGDVVQFSGTGTFMDGTNNDVALYFYPWDAEGNLQLYYIAVFNNLGVPQYTREGWPNSYATDNPGANNISENMVSNSQFVDVNFNTTAGTTISFTGVGSTTVAIAPDWDLNINYSGTGSVIVSRTSVTGDANRITNPPYILSIVPGVNVIGLTLTQKLNHNPGIWSALVAGTGGYVAANMVLGSGSNVQMYYTPSIGTQTELLNGNNTTSVFQEYSATVQLPPSDNSATSDTGYVNLTLDLSTGGTTLITSIQVVGLNGFVTGIEYEQETVNRQIDHLFNYYKPKLDFKPIPSYLVGWDFPLNPAQLGTAQTAFNTGANTSNYVWDQTIVFQSINQGFTTSRHADGSLLLTYALAGQLAVIQYLEAPMVRDMLNNRLSVAIKAAIKSGVTLSGNVSLYYTTDSQLPNMATPNFKSLVLTLDTTGKPATFNGNWTEVARSNFGAATFNITNPGANLYSLNEFNGWQVSDLTAITTATYFAIVIGTASALSTTQLAFSAASVVPGDIATLPAPKTITETLLDCERYYWDTFPPGVVATDNPTTVGVIGAISYICQVSGTAAGFGVSVPFPAQMRAIPGAIFYNPSAGTPSRWFNAGNGTSGSDSGIASIAASAATMPVLTTGVSYATVKNPQVPSTDVPGNLMCVHASFDARLGVIL